MTGLVDWASQRSRMVLAFIALSIAIGAYAYTSLPKEGEPDIEIPALFVSVPFNGISAQDSETLLVKPMETELADLDGLKTMSGTAAENYAGVAMQFEFGWDKTRIMADVRDAMTRAQAKFPDGADNYSINEINFSEFPIVIVNLTGPLPERTMVSVAKALRDKLEALDAVLEAGIAGSRDEMLEVTIDPLRLESYNVTAGELINVVRNNNQLIAAGELDGATGTFGIKIPSSFDEALDVYDLPVKTNGDRVITLGELAQINLTFEDRTGTARFNGENTVALQVVKRRGFNIIDTVALVNNVIAEAASVWPTELQASVEVGTSNDQSRQVGSMVDQLVGSVLTAIALVMLVTLAALGIRPALLVGFAIPTSFLLCFALLALMGVAISNIVMFGLILAVGMLVDGAIVIVEYADKRIKEGAGPMQAYVQAAKRMFWPVVSSTATTLCAFLPMLFWPGVPGEFMGMLPVTLIFILSASLVVALIYLPVVGGVSGRFSRILSDASLWMRAHVPYFGRLGIVLSALAIMAWSAFTAIQGGVSGGFFGALAPGGLLLVLSGVLLAVSGGAIQRQSRPDRLQIGYQRSFVARAISVVVGNWYMPFVTITAVVGFVIVTFWYFGNNNNGVEFFVESEPEQAIVYVQARGNLSLAEKDALLTRAEIIVMAHPGVQTAFAFAGDGGLNNNTGGAQPPKDTIGQIQFETIPWEDRPNARALTDIFGLNFSYAAKDLAFDGDTIIADLTAELKKLPGTKIEILAQARGPASAKPVHLRLKGDNWQDLLDATRTARATFDTLPGLTLVEDTLPLPGIDWQIDVDVEKAGRYGADVATVGAMVQLITRGILLDTYTPTNGDEEIEIRVRLPEEYRVLSTLDTLKVRTPDGLIPLANFITRTPVAKLAQIDRVGQTRYFDVKAGVETGTQLWQHVTNGETITAAVLREDPLPGSTIQQVTGPDGARFEVLWLDERFSIDLLRSMLEENDGYLLPLTPNERISALTEWLDTGPFGAGIEWEWTGDQEDEAESQAFLGNAFLGALGLMFIILLAQFNSIYNAALVLLAVVLSTAGVLWGMILMGQSFSIIMTGTGIVALAGIVVNNNIVLIDTYQEYARYMPRVEAIIRTVQARIRPVALTTITTIAGLLPMMIGLSLNFAEGGYTVDSPTALWWKQLATAVVFGLGISTVLTLVFTPAMLAARIWFWTALIAILELVQRTSSSGSSRLVHDWALRQAAKEVHAPEILWNTEPEPQQPSEIPLRAAE